MTLQMILALAILIIMIVLIMTDALPFGAPALLADCLLVVAGAVFGSEWEVQWDVTYAFSGFTNSAVLMAGFFMVVVAASKKTRFLAGMRSIMLRLVDKGGVMSYIALLAIVMLIGSVAGAATGIYVLILSLLATMPYNEKSPASRLILPVGFATQNPLIPMNVAVRWGIATSILAAAGVTQEVPVISFSIMTFFASMGFLIWAIIGRAVLPVRDIPSAEGNDLVNVHDGNEGTGLSQGQEVATGIAFVVGVVAMICSNVIGQMAYVIPGLCAFFLVAIKVIDFKELRSTLFSPIIIMMAGVIPVANALGDSGLTALIGNSVASIMGAEMPGFVVVLVFAVITSICSTLTGSSMGSIYVFAPIAVATCMALGLNPVAAACAVTVSGWCGGFLPIDGLPAMIMGVGGYSIKEFWKFTIPMYVIKIVALCLGAVIVFPM